MLYNNKHYEQDIANHFHYVLYLLHTPLCMCNRGTMVCYIELYIESHYNLRLYRKRKIVEVI